MDDRPSLTDRTLILNDLACGACGYNLHGLTTDGNCPECGYWIKKSLAMNAGMTKREIAALACRLLALWILMRAVVFLAQFATMLAVFITSQLSIRTGPGVVALVASGLPFVGAIIVGGLLWWKANWLACRMFPRDGIATVSYGMNVRAWIVVASVAIGLVFLTLGIATIARTAPLWHTLLPWPHAFWSQMAGACAQFVLGLVLIVGSRRIGQMLTWLRTAGTQWDEDDA